MDIRPIADLRRNERGPSKVRQWTTPAFSCSRDPDKLDGLTLPKGTAMSTLNQCESQGVLFQVELHKLEADRAQDARWIVSQLPDERVLSSVSDVGIGENIFERLRFQLPAIQRYNIAIPEIITEFVMGRNVCGEPTKVKRLFAKLAVPFEGDGTAFHARPPSQQRVTNLRADVHPGQLSHLLLIDNKSIDQTHDELNLFLRELRRMLEALRIDFEGADARLRDKIAQVLDERRGMVQSAGRR
jgi:hypothetical protein